MQQTIRPIAEQQKRIGTFKSLAFTGWEYEEGWFVSFASAASEPSSFLWVNGAFASPCFHSISQKQFEQRGPVEIDPELIEVTPEVKDAILGMLWEWEVWEPITVAGTCAIDSLVLMLDLSRDVLLDWFRSGGRNPSVQEDIVSTLEDNGYTVEIAGPAGFGKFHDYRRLVSMFQKSDPQSGHVVLIYENDKDIFDAAGVFKKVGDVVWSDTLGYNRGPVLKIEKRQSNADLA